MKSVYNFVVKPKGERYNNTKKIDMMKGKNKINFINNIFSYI